MPNYELIITDDYRKKEKDFLKKHRDLAETYVKVMNVLSVDPYYPSLRLHKLQGKLREFYSISMNMQYRIVIDFVIQNNQIIPLNIGDHSVYK